MTTTLQRICDEQARFASFQAGVNASHGLSPVIDRTADEIRNYARHCHARYPQYSQAWAAEDGWHLVRIGCDVTTKMGVAFKAGDICLAKHHRGLGFSPSDWTVYSVRNGCDTRLSYGVHRLEDN
jgi:hypothetical protein